MTNQEIKLQDPGAGISRAEMVLLNRLIKPFLIKNSGAQSAMTALKRSASKLEDMLARLGEKQLLERVLVSRPWFVEDSSRNWSAALLCRHLAIVDGALAGAIEKGLVLQAALLPEPSKRVAAVKPEHSRNDVSALTDFRNSVSSLVSAAEKHKESDLACRVIPHPWLGDISHLQWIWFASFHHEVHLRQLRKIVRELESKGVLK